MNNEFKNADFLDDEEKMRDFIYLTKEEFLSSYSYLTEDEYNNSFGTQGKATRCAKQILDTEIEI